MIHKNVRIDDRFRLTHKIFQGPRSSIFAAIDTSFNKDVAVKIEENVKINVSSQTLNKECQMLKFLSGIKGIPKFVHYCSEKGYNALVMELLGKDFETIMSLHRRIHLKNVIIIITQVIKILQEIHKKGLIHRDLKPSNILIGYEDKANEIYLTDFGISRHFNEQKRKSNSRTKRPFIGTIRYCSESVHFGDELFPKDDLESLCYIMIYFLRGKLPWQGVPGDHKTRIAKIGNIKKKLIYIETFNDLPEEINVLFQYTKNLKNNEIPDYKRYLKILKTLFEDKKFSESYDFDADYNMKSSSKQEFTAPNLDAIQKNINQMIEKTNNNFLQKNRRKSDLGFLNPMNITPKQFKRGSVQLVFDPIQFQTQSQRNSIFSIQEIEEEG